MCDLCPHTLSLRHTGVERSLLRLSKLCVSPRVGGAYLGGGCCTPCVCSLSVPGDQGVTQNTVAIKRKPAVTQVPMERNADGD